MNFYFEPQPQLNKHKNIQTCMWWICIGGSTCSYYLSYEHKDFTNDAQLTNIQHANMVGGKCGQHLLTMYAS